MPTTPQTTFGHKIWCGKTLVRDMSRISGVIYLRDHVCQVPMPPVPQGGRSELELSSLRLFSWLAVKTLPCISGPINPSKSNERRSLCSPTLACMHIVPQSNYPRPQRLGSTKKVCAVACAHLPSFHSSSAHTLLPPWHHLYAAWPSHAWGDRPKAP